MASWVLALVLVWVKELSVEASAQAWVKEVWTEAWAQVQVKLLQIPVEGL
jgi:hypothetical protein